MFYGKTFKVYLTVIIESVFNISHICEIKNFKC